jgi:hypothetical protein
MTLLFATKPYQLFLSRDIRPNCSSTLSHLISLVLKTLDNIHLPMAIRLLRVGIQVKLPTHRPLRHRLSQDWAAGAAEDEL